MKIKLSEIKSWNPEIESKITSGWQKKGNPFNAKAKKIYSIDTPPPYVNTPVHMGHAVTYCYMDFFARYKRMKGFEVLFPLGLDRNGLPIEMAAEKRFNVEPMKIGREKFIEYCKKVLKEASQESIETFEKLGISFNSYKKGKEIGDIYLTDSQEYRTLTQATFIDLHKKGLVYEDSRINNWDIKLQTTIADSEIDYREINSNFSYIKWKIKETGKEIIIATTRPELICTCGMIIFNPDDKRYQHLEGKTAISPLYDKEIPIKAHPFAQTDKGSGLVMMCSAGDLTDIQFFREQNLTPVIAINKYGKMNQHSGFLQDLKVKEAREKIISLLKEKHLLAKQEQITHKTPISERSGAEIEFIEMPEFYLRQVDFLDRLREISNQINFYPKESKVILDSWINSISIDWPISRRRYYATPIPLWHSENGKYVAVPPKGKYYEPWKNSPPMDSDVYLKEKPEEVLGKIKDKEFKKIKWLGETRVFDTWFDSSISELFIVKYPSEFSKKAYPITLRAQGKEIVRTWLYYTLLRALHEKNEPAFKDVWIHQHILDDKGRKMSKSLGNTIDPQTILKEEGAEALRLWAAIEGNLAQQDLSCSRERIRAELKTINKILNVAKFITQFKKPRKKPQLTKTDRHFIAYADYLAQFADAHYERYDFYNPSIKLRHFLWEIFASHYLELIKNRAYNEEKRFSKKESESAHYTLHYLLERFLTLMHPIIPQISSVIAESIKLKLKEFPLIKKTDEVSVNLIALQLVKFNSMVWKRKKEQGISLKDPIKKIKIPESLKDFEKDLKACHNLE